MVWRCHRQQGDSRSGVPVLTSCFYCVVQYCILMVRSTFARDGEFSCVCMALDDGDARMTCKGLNDSRRDDCWAYYCTNKAVSI